MDIARQKTIGLLYVPGEITFDAKEKINGRCKRTTITGGYLCFDSLHIDNLYNLNSVIYRAIIPEGTIVKDGKVSTYIRFNTSFVKCNIDLTPYTVITILDFYSAGDSISVNLYGANFLKEVEDLNLILVAGATINSKTDKCYNMDGFKFSPVTCVNRIVSEEIIERHEQYLYPMASIGFLSNDEYTKLSK